MTVIVGAGLKVGTRTDAFDPLVPAGSVVSQDPDPGLQAAPGTPVDYVVSKGPEPSPSPTPTPTPTPTPPHPDTQSRPRHPPAAHAHPDALPDPAPPTPSADAAATVGNYVCQTLGDAKAARPERRVHRRVRRAAGRARYVVRLGAGAPGRAPSGRAGTDVNFGVRSRSPTAAPEGAGPTWIRGRCHPRGSSPWSRREGRRDGRDAAADDDRRRRRTRAPSGAASRSSTATAPRADPARPPRTRARDAARSRGRAITDRRGRPGLAGAAAPRRPPSMRASRRPGAGRAGGRGRRTRGPGRPRGGSGGRCHSSSWTAGTPSTGRSPAGRPRSAGSATTTCPMVVAIRRGLSR